MKTKNGIYTDLKESEYFFNYGNYNYYFSSKFYQNKFEKNYENYVAEEIEKLQVKYKVDIDYEFYLSLVRYFMESYYKKVEKRGYRITINEK